MNNLRSNLARLRKYHKLTQVEAAQALGVIRSRYNGWEGGQAEPNIAMLLALSKVYRMSIDRMVTADLAPLTDGDITKLLRP